MTYLEQIIDKTIIDVEVTTSESIAFVTSLEENNNENINSTSKDKTGVGLAVRLYFKEYVLEIYRPGKIYGIRSQSFDVLKGLTIAKISESDKEAVIYFNTKIELRINLDPENFAGPESMCLLGPNNLIVVW